MTPPFPSDLAPRAARQQAAQLLVLFYAVVYGTGLVAGGMRHRLASPILSAMLIGSLMLLIVLVLIRRDRSAVESLGLAREPMAAVVGWSLAGLVGTYVVNLVLTTLYIATAADLERLAARRATWLGALSELPAEIILPLAAFVGLWEELVFRGFLLGRLRVALSDRGLSTLQRDALAVALTALFFGAGHGYQGILGLIQTTVAGVVLGALTVGRGSLWPAIGTHLAIDVFGLFVVKAVARNLA
jgi:membrane protease YdiL (CAAX protease family)